jgi:hypothetical protein
MIKQELRTGARPTAHVDDFDFDFGGFVRGGASMVPGVTLQRDGGVSLNSAASELLFGNNVPERVAALIGLNRTRDRLAVRIVPIGTPGSLNAKRANNRGGYSFSAAHQLHVAGVDRRVARRYNAERIDGGLGVCIDLRGPFTEVIQGGHARR